MCTPMQPRWLHILMRDNIMAMRQEAENSVESQPLLLYSHTVLVRFLHLLALKSNTII